MNLHKLLSVFLILFCAASFPASAKNVKALKPQISINQAMRGMAKPSNLFASDKYADINKMNAKFSGTTRALSRAAEEDQLTPIMTIGPNQIFYDIDGPNGQLWYCTADLKSKPIEHEYYTEYVLTEYSYSIYDAEFNLVGTIHDKMRYLPNEVRVPGPEAGIGILPIVTKNFFNNDDKYEIVISIAVNTTTEGLNHYRSVIYSLGGEKEKVTVERGGNEVEIEVDKPVSQLNSFVSDVINASKGNEENVYMTFMGESGGGFDIDFEKLLSGDEAEGQKYWNILSKSGYKFSIYGKADANGKLVKVFEDFVSYQNMQGDQESTPVMFTLTHNNEPYIVFPHYRDTFYNPYYSPFEDMTMRENNSLIIDLFKISGTSTTRVSSTEIPIEKAKGSSILATYYSVGDLEYARDVEMSDDAIPTYLITRCNYTTASDETTGFCYYKYDVEGNKKLTIFENAESRLVLTDVPGKDRQGMFVIFDDFLGYVYNFVDLNTGFNDKTVQISYLLDTGFDDPEVLSFNMDRVPLNDGTYKYAFEMRVPLVDEDDNNFIRIAWFNADGSFDRIDHVNMGKNVNYATAYINGVVLNPTFIKADEAYEYMVLIKRSIDASTSTSQEELIIGQPADEDLLGGSTLLHLTPCDKGALQSISIYPATDDNSYRMFIGYTANRGYTADFYALPLGQSGVGSIIADKKPGSEISFSGSAIIAQGLQITVYNTNGVAVAKGVSELSTETLPAGIYLAKAGNSTCKFVVK